MPISIRKLGPTFSAASYRFPSAQIQSAVEDWPWLRAPDSHSQLCAICTQLNFSWLFRESLAGFTVSDGTISSQLSDGICIGLYADILRRSDCSFCQLLVYSLEEGADIDMMNDHDEWPQQEIWLRNHALFGSGTKVVDFASRKDEHVVRLDVRLKANNEENIMFSSGGPGGRTVTIQMTRRDPVSSLVQSFEGRAVDQATAELVQTIQQWIHPCLDIHESTATHPTNHDRASIRLIDTTNACIVGPKRHERYVALSYTWGKIDPLVLLKQNGTELRKQGALLTHKSRLPITIQDSIKLCKMLGERYLWVDSLCIMQDTADKHDQIQQMDRIYQEAVLCIVAAAGRDANAGLPGISAPRDVRQHIVDIEGMNLANTVPDLVPSLGSTFWRSRGWCFQENLLSSRKLIFTPDQTYFHCLHGQCTEDTHCFDHSKLVSSRDHSSLGLDTDNVSNWRVYKNVVAEYSSCELSFEDDMLNAFVGISSFLSKALFLGCPFLMGIPLCSLEVGLLWQPATRLRRRSGTNLPSWAWVGWVGMINYADENENVFERTIGHMQWDVGSISSDATSTANQAANAITPKGWTRHVVGDLNQIHYTRNDLPPTRWFSHPIAELPWPSRLPTNPLLNCIADIATLNITGEHAELWYQSCDDDEHDICHLQVFDHNGHRAGVVVMDGATFEHTAFSQHAFTFVKVSQTTLMARDDPAWDEESKSYAGRPGESARNPRDALDPSEEEFDQDVYDRNICWCMYNVLVVEFEEDVARRIAVGRVHVSAFDGACAERREFCLG